MKLKTYAEFRDEEFRRYREKMDQIFVAKGAINYANSLDLKTLNKGWIDGDGINFMVTPMYKKDILIYCDETFWSGGVETSDPTPRLYGETAEIIIQVFPHGTEEPGLYITFAIKEGEGCQRVRVGTKEVPKYEWICS